MATRRYPFADLDRLDEPRLGEFARYCALRCGQVIATIGSPETRNSVLAALDDNSWTSEAFLTRLTACPEYDAEEGPTHAFLVGYAISGVERAALAVRGVDGVRQDHLEQSGLCLIGVMGELDGQVESGAHRVPALAEYLPVFEVTEIERQATLIALLGLGRAVDIDEFAIASTLPGQALALTSY